MSAYGSISAPKRTTVLKPRAFPSSNPALILVVFPLRKEDVPHELASLLHTIFNDVVQEGKTYPQDEPLSEAAFESYYLANDLFLGVLAPSEVHVPLDGMEDTRTLDECRAGRSWQACVAGMYYVKPNYPGRSSHNCNAGFIVAPQHRGLRLGFALGQSYLHFAPLLGYRASVFNLVYVSNKASLAIWDKLGFSRVGLVPQAGRLKTGPHGEEEYVDAVVYWKSFI